MPHFRIKDEQSITLCLYVPGFQGQAFKRVKILSEGSKKMKEQKRTKGASLLQNPPTIHKMHCLVFFETLSCSNFVHIITKAVLGTILGLVDYKMIFKREVNALACKGD